jgi:hypothetical protein
VLNGNGELLGLIHQSTINSDHYAVDPNLSTTFQLTGLSINDVTLSKSFIRTALPKEQNAALLTLMMAKQKGDSLKLSQYIDDFIAAFPTSNDGYLGFASMETLFSLAANVEASEHNSDDWVYHKASDTHQGSYVIQKTHDNRTSSDYLDLIGTLDNEHVIVIQVHV